MIGGKYASLLTSASIKVQLTFLSALPTWTLGSLIRLLFVSRLSIMKMNKFDWTDAIKTNIYILRLVGLWPEGDQSYKPDFYTIYAAVTIVFFMGCHSLFQTINIFLGCSDLEGLAATIFVTVTDLLTLVKIYCFIKNMKTIKKLMVILNSDVFQPRNIKQMILVQPTLIFWKKICLVLIITVGIAVPLWCLFPVFDKTAEKRRLPFSSWYPYNVKESPIYEITYLHQVVSICFICAANLNLDTFIVGLMMYVGAQCDILCDNLRNLECRTFGRNLIRCIEHHKAILKFSQDCNKSFNAIAFGQFFTSSACIALTLFRLTVVETFKGEFYSLVVFLSAAIQEIFLYCWFGNDVEIKSARIFYAAFESDWTGIFLEAKKNLFVFMMKCQNPIRMSAYNLFYLSLGIYVKILRASWSYFALLHEVDAR